MGTNLATLEQLCARRSGWYWSDNPSANSGATTSFVVNDAPSALDSDDQAAFLTNTWARVESDTADPPLNVGGVRRVSGYAPSTSTITLSRGFTNNPTTTQTVGIYKTTPPGEQFGMALGWRHYLNRVLQSIRYRRYGVLTLVADGDMENSATGNWLASNCTVSKVATAAGTSLGARALQVVNSALNGYARSIAVPVTPADTYYLRADLKVTSGTGHLVAYDETQSAEIESDSSTSRDWRYLAFSVLIPDGCHSLSVRLKGAESSADIYWDNVSLRHAHGYRLGLPSWITEAAQVDGLFRWEATNSQDDRHQVSSQLEYRAVRYEVIEDATGATPFLAEWKSQPPATELLFVRGMSPYDELSSMTDITAADRDIVVAGARYLAYRDLYGNNDSQAQTLLRQWQILSTRLPKAQQLIRGQG